MDTLNCLHASGCKRCQYRRGPCSSHYESTKKRVQKGLMTWEELEVKGQARCDGRKRAKDFHRWLVQNAPYKQGGWT